MPRVRNIMSYIPEYLQQSSFFEVLYGAYGDEFDDARFQSNRTVDQCFVDTATWGLKLWEQVMGIPVDESKPVEQRRAFIKSKVRGTGTVTIEKLQSVAQSYDDGEISIIEHNADNCFEVKFIGTKGTPDNIDDLKAVIETIKPAHLAVTYTYSYNMYQDLTGYTHGQLSAYTHEQIREVN